MSGSALSPWAVARDAAFYAQQVGRHLGCPVSEATAFVECLRHRPVQDLIGIALDVPDYLTAFGPTIDGSVVAGEPRQEMASLTSPFAQHDLLFGVVKFESYFGFSSHEEKHGFEVSRLVDAFRCELTIPHGSGGGGGAGAGGVCRWKPSRPHSPAAVAFVKVGHLSIICELFPRRAPS